MFELRKFFQKRLEERVRDCVSVLAQSAVATSPSLSATPAMDRWFNKRLFALRDAERACLTPEHAIEFGVMLCVSNGGMVRASHKRPTQWRLDQIVARCFVDDEALWPELFLSHCSKNVCSVHHVAGPRIESLSTRPELLSSIAW